MGGITPTQLVIIAVVIVILFGARKLPDFARGAGQALRIFKAETKSLTEDDDQSTDQAARGELPASSPDTVENVESAPETKRSGNDGA